MTSLFGITILHSRALFFEIRKIYKDVAVIFNDPLSNYTRALLDPCKTSLFE